MLTVTVTKDCLKCGAVFEPPDANDGECHGAAAVSEVMARLIFESRDVKCPNCGSNLCSTSIAPDRVPVI